MYKDQIPKINETIKKTRKAIIALGCSFVQGHGAIDQKIYENYRWTGSDRDYPNVQWNLTEDEKIQLINEFSNIELGYEGHLDFTKHEVNNSFVNVLAKKYFEGSYAAINLGRSGCGNRAAIKELYFYPDILWDLLDEIIVLYCPSGSERFDFITDLYHKLNEHGRWICIWPNDRLDESGPKADLSRAYKDALFSNKFEILEQIVHIQELILWCKYHKAKLIITPAFQEGRYTKKNFQNSLSENIIRNSNCSIKSTSFIKNRYNIIPLINLWPWDKMFRPGGYETFVDFVISRELIENSEKKYFYNYLGTGSPNLWITPCAHPSAKAHDIFAQELYKEIVTNIDCYKF